MTLEGYFESLAPQGFQNNPFSRSGTKEWELAPPKGALTFQVVSTSPWGQVIAEHRTFN